MQDLITLLQKRIEYMHTDSWGKRGAPKLRLSKNTRQDPVTFVLSGSLEVLVPAKNGELEYYQTHNLSGIKTSEEIDDLLADILSKVLADHMNWPR